MFRNLENEPEISLLEIYLKEIIGSIKSCTYLLMCGLPLQKENGKLLLQLKEVICYSTRILKIKRVGKRERELKEEN